MSDGDAPDPDVPRRGLAVTVGESLPEVELDLTFTKVAGVMVGTRDLFRGHHDPRFAEEQGQQAIYVNTMFLQGFLDRVALGWVGRDPWFATRREMRMRDSAYAGDVLRGRGRVVEVVHDGDGEPEVITVDVEAMTERGTCVEANVTISRWREAGRSTS